MAVNIEAAAGDQRSREQQPDAAACATHAGIQDAADASQAAHAVDGFCSSLIESREEFKLAALNPVPPGICNVSHRIQTKTSDILAVARIRAAEWETEEYWNRRIWAYLAGELDPKFALKPRVSYVSAKDLL